VVTTRSAATARVRKRRVNPLFGVAVGRLPERGDAVEVVAEAQRHRVPAAKFARTGQGPGGDLEPLIRARGFMVFGSSKIVILYADLVREAEAWIKGTVAGQPSEREFKVVENAGLAVEFQIHVEMRPQPSRWQRMRQAWRKPE
jgi:hypothetical protein